MFTFKDVSAHRAHPLARGRYRHFPFVYKYVRTNGRVRRIVRRFLKNVRQCVS